MYIIHETLAGNDPRLDPRAKAIGSYWHFTIREVQDGVYIDRIPHEKLSAEVAKSVKLTGAYKDVISLSRPANNIDEIQQVSGDVEWQKYVYKLTKQDKKNVVVLMKTAMNMYAKTHLEDQETLHKLIEVVNSASTIEGCEYVLYHYFNVGSATTNGKPKEPKFIVKWPEIL